MKRLFAPLRDEPPLPPRGLVLWDHGGAALADWIARHGNADLRGVDTEDALVVIASRTESLPWIAGATYIAPTLSAELWLPTLLRPCTDPEWIVRALGELPGRPKAPLLALPDERLVISLAHARTLDLDVIATHASG